MKRFTVELTEAELATICDALNSVASVFITRAEEKERNNMKPNLAFIFPPSTIQIWRQSAKDRRALTRHLMTERKEVK